jgi:glycine/D-amino acid oxidase-like deaminating enzyme
MKGRLFAETCVTEVSEDRHGVTVKTATGLTVAADAVVVATNAPINDRLAINGKQAPFRTYVIAGPVKRGSVPDHLYWDTAEPYHYVRLNPWRDDKDSRSATKRRGLLSRGPPMD